MKNSIAKQVRNKAILMIALVLVMGGAGAVVGSFVGQTMEEQTDMQEYTQLQEQAQQAEVIPLSVTESEKPEKTEAAATPPPASDLQDESEKASDKEDAPAGDLELPEAQAADESELPQESAAEDTVLPSESSLPEGTSASQAPYVPVISPSSSSSSGNSAASRVNLSALQAQNSDFVAWLRIPGTGIDYPVVWSDDTDYYLNHTFTGKESSVGTLISQRKTNYAAPSQNIAIYGHHLRTNNMFTPLLSYKKQDYWQAHDTVELETLYGSGTYRIFAVLNMNIRDWEPSAPDFADEASFSAFVNRAKTESFYGTGVEVSASDEILTLITCDRSFAGADGRMVVMAVKTE